METIWYLIFRAFIDIIALHWEDAVQGNGGDNKKQYIKPKVYRDVILNLSTPISDAIMAII